MVSGDDGHAEGLRRKAGRLAERFWSLSEGRRVAALLMVALLVYSSLFALMVATGFGEDIFFGEEGSPIPVPYDVRYYQDRASNLLEGKIPYLEFYSESPPLIMYAFIPAALMGNSPEAYALLFSFYVFLTAALMYAVLRRRDERGALLATSLFLLNPISLGTALILVQDEAAVTLFYAVPVLLMLLGWGRLSVITATLGALTKVFSAVLLPLAFIYQDREGRRRSLIALAIAAATVALPLLAFAGEAFLRFPRYYLKMSGDEGIFEGISFWRFLQEAGLAVPGLLLQALFAIGTLAMLYLIWRRGIDPLRGSVLMLMPFFLFFPKITGDYYMVFLAPVCALALVDLRPTFWILAAAVLSALCQLFNSYGGMEAVLPMDGLWVLAPLAMSLLVHIVLIHLTLRLLRMGPQPVLEPEGR